MRSIIASIVALFAGSLVIGTEFSSCFADEARNELADFLEVQYLLADQLENHEVVCEFVETDVFEEKVVFLEKKKWRIIHDCDAKIYAKAHESIVEIDDRPSVGLAIIPRRNSIHGVKVSDRAIVMSSESSASKYASFEEAVADVGGARANYWHLWFIFSAPAKRTDIGFYRESQGVFNVSRSNGKTDYTFTYPPLERGVVRNYWTTNDQGQLIEIRRSVQPPGKEIDVYIKQQVEWGELDGADVPIRISKSAPVTNNVEKEGRKTVEATLRWYSIQDRPKDLEVADLKTPLGIKRFIANGGKVH
jgi:hypothetical protein